MFRLILSAAVVFFASTSAFASDLTPGSIIGKYKVTAKAGFMKVYMNFNVVSTTEFEIQRTYANGSTEEVCNGSFSLDANIFRRQDRTLANGKIFKGVFSCPSNRQKNISFNIDFKDKTTQDLIRGTNVIVTSSMAPGRAINAFVIKK